MYYRKYILGKDAFLISELHPLSFFHVKWRVLGVDGFYVELESHIKINYKFEMVASSSRT
jgi:hypothetical protein